MFRLMSRTTCVSISALMVDAHSVLTEQELDHLQVFSVGTCTVRHGMCSSLGIQHKGNTQLCNTTCEVLSRWRCSPWADSLCQRAAPVPSLLRICRCSRPWGKTTFQSVSRTLAKNTHANTRHSEVFTGVKACPRRCWQSEVARQSCPAGGNAQSHDDQSERRSEEGRGLRCPERWLETEGAENVEGYRLQMMFVFEMLPMNPLD